jgi:proteasome lid subunit RPN8/RPN11
MERGHPASLMNQLILTREQWERMQAHVEAAAPLEACGMLAGKDGRVSEVLPVTNQLQSPARFRMDAIEQVQAFDRFDREGLELLGIFHSHPNGPEYPSVTDIEEAAYAVVYIIWSRTQGNWTARGFGIVDGQAREVNLELIV